ncbi:large subunit ribosomal protein L9 [Lipingzhangella halophila]|uniref:Large ribosomal subunit protein bL9 n=1 Tax=Lipingzhangella halophila TaxID=1783352 RepID=A0A7W7W5N0_9ACTN|nr:50S ribosomal protein L9 [Lipingzhangella halophila]MBB4935397.1 large subunit ribosomal protein L9 [Lipingzhangella halophila]
MKLIMTHEVTGLGAPGDIVEVRDGYGRNYLLPRGLAVKWTRGGQKQVDQIRRARQARDIRDLDEAKEVAERLGGMKVQLSQRAGKGGRLFGSVTASKVAEAVKASGGPAVDKRRVEIRNAIKSVGEHKVEVRLHPEVSATISLEVTGA